MVPADRPREGWADCLRCLAAAMVVALHCAAAFLTRQAPGTWAFFALNLADSATRWAVPVFFMLSGAFLLDPERELPAKRWLGHVGRLAWITLLWSCLYALLDCRGAHLGAEHILEALAAVLAGRLHFHLWFMPVLLCLYLLLPVLRAPVRRWPRWGLWLAVALLGAAALARDLLRTPPATDCQWLRALDPPTLAGYAAYFLLGWLLRGCTLSRRQAAGLYIAGGLGLAVTALGTQLWSARTGQLQVELYSNFAVNVAVTAVALFVLFRRRVRGGHPAWSGLSSLTLGVYLAHPMLREDLARHGFPGAAFGPVGAALVQLLAVLPLALALAWLLRRIPRIGRHLC